MKVLLSVTCPTNPALCPPDTAATLELSTPLAEAARTAVEGILSPTFTPTTGTSPFPQPVAKVGAQSITLSSITFVREGSYWTGTLSGHTIRTEVLPFALSTALL